MIEETFYIIKPEAIHRADEVRADISKRFEIVDYLRIALTKDDVRLLSKLDLGYKVDEELFEAFQYFLRSGVVEVGIIRGQDAVNRFFNFCGEYPDPTCCDENTLRSIYGNKFPGIHLGVTFYLNGVHKSSTSQEAYYEVGLYNEVFSKRTMLENCIELSRRVYETPHENTNSAYITELGNLWDYHIIPVINCSKVISRQFGACEESLQIAACFHDVGRIVDSDENHHISSAIIARKYLEELYYDPNKLQLVIDSIDSHRGDLSKDRRSAEAKALAAADGIATINYWPLVCYSSYSKHKLGIRAGVIKALDKLEKAWKKIPDESKHYAQESYSYLTKTFSRFDIET